MLVNVLNGESQFKDIRRVGQLMNNPKGHLKIDVFNF